MSPLSAWDNFYVIVGSSAGALTGLVFVVISLTSGRRASDMSWGVAAYTTPTVVHFGVALSISAALSAPWPALWQAGVPLGLCGVGGLVYCAVVWRRMRRQVSYEPVGEDWLWFAVAPVVAYLSLLVAALFLASAPTPMLFTIGATILLLMIIGIHNAWDLVTYIAIEVVGPAEQAAKEGEHDQRRGPEA